ncbi:MAG: type II toxin-antitoxin system VapC family toxin [Planctomycetes bacterium]|nr:type II toxin-antitoxin system VapC family toxin [Planctomycetota bacterium]MCB9918605.1 type II toxin-antitoxin system VapC family toxin [Planctomycetota bacterium]
MKLVVDASVALDWVFDSERTPYGQEALSHVIDAGAAVPALWPVEVANGLLSGLRRRRITEPEMAEAVSMLASLPIEIVATTASLATMPPLLEQGARFGLSAYDASYLLLAQREGLPLATNDARLRGAAQLAGVPILGLETAGAR